MIFVEKLELPHRNFFLSRQKILRPEFPTYGIYGNLTCDWVFIISLEFFVKTFDWFLINIKKN